MLGMPGLMPACIGLEDPQHGKSSKTRKIDVGFPGDPQGLSLLYTKRRCCKALATCMVSLTLTHAVPAPGQASPRKGSEEESTGQRWPSSSSAEYVACMTETKRSQQFYVV